MLIKDKEKGNGYGSHWPYLVLRECKNASLKLQDKPFVLSLVAAWDAHNKPLNLTLNFT